jgi:hypothetical protein
MMIAWRFASVVRARFCRKGGALSEPFRENTGPNSGSLNTAVPDHARAANFQVSRPNSLTRSLP